MNEEVYQDQDQNPQAEDKTTLMAEGAEALTGDSRLFENMRNVAQVARDSFPELIDYYDPEKDEII
ncbi:MAG TPA: hypothetical protein VE710_07645 [Candidatus Bathyarchaeia archaeon]|nr:hypothetical protein [Candidatus Bathyarchaeia archaeon]